MTNKANEDLTTQPQSNVAAQQKVAKDNNHEEMSPEDLQLSEELASLVESIQSQDQDESLQAISAISKHLTKATNSLTSVPKPLKYLGSHFETILQFYSTLNNIDKRRIELAGILSMLCIVYGKDKPRQVLKFRLEGHLTNFTSLGFEYITHLCDDIVKEYEEQQNLDDIVKMIPEITQFLMKSQAQIETIDFLCEIEHLEMIIPYVDDFSLNKVVPYIIGISHYPSLYTEHAMLKICYDILIKHKKYCEGFRVAMKMEDKVLCLNTFDVCDDVHTHKQMALMCHSQRFSMQMPFNEQITSLMCGEHNGHFFLHLAKELDVTDPKTPQDVYKTNHDDRRSTIATETDKLALANIYVNAFVNAGFCTNELISKYSVDNVCTMSSYCREAVMCAMGCYYVWNPEEIGRFDKYIQKKELNFGGLISTGLISSNVITSFDLAYSLLQENMQDDIYHNKLGAIIGLGFAYAGTNRTDILEDLIPCLLDESLGKDINLLSAISLGLIFIGSCNQDAADAIMQYIFQLPKNVSEECHLYFVALGFIFMCKKEACEPCLLTLEASPSEIKAIAITIVEGMAYTGSGDVRKVKSMIDDFFEKDNLPNFPWSYHAFCFINVALITMGDNIATDMVVRLLDHLLQNEDDIINSAAPLALSLCSISNPQQPIVDTLYKLSHSSRPQISYNAFFGLGLVGAGTNNSRIAGLLRQLAVQNAKDSDAISIIRLSQGLLHMSKGLVSINPVHSEKLLINKVALGGLMIVVYYMLRSKISLSTQYHYFFYYLTLAMKPRMLLTVDEELNPLPVLVRVGQSVDTVGQAGQLKTVTGFQTHNTPVLLSANERAELATDEYIPVTSILEGVVILKKNPDYNPDIHK